MTWWLWILVVVVALIGFSLVSGAEDYRPRRKP